MRKTTLLKYSVSAVAATLLVACGGGGGGGANTETQAPTATTGVAVDFYLSGSTVTFANSRCATATTNSLGEFPIPRQDCGAITVKGGTDIATGLALKGRLTAPGGSTVVSPVTTLIQSLVDSGLPLAQAQASVTTALALGQDPTKTDPLKDQDALAQTMALVQIAQQTTDAFTRTAGLTTATYEEVYANVLKNVASALPANATALVALDAAFVTRVSQATAKEISPNSPAAQNAAKLIGPAVADIAKSAADQITNERAAFAATQGNAAAALELATSRSNINENIRTLSGLGTILAAELAKYDLATADAATISAQIRAAVNPNGRIIASARPVAPATPGIPATPGAPSTPSTPVAPVTTTMPAR